MHVRDPARADGGVEVRVAGGEVLREPLQLVGAAEGGGVELEDLRELVARVVAVRLRLGRVDGALGVVGLEQLPLEDLLLERARRQQPVRHDAPRRRARPVHAADDLPVGGGVPRRVEEDEVRRADEVEAAAARLGREQEDARRLAAAVEALDELDALVGRRRAVEPQRRPAALLADALHQVEHAREVARDDDARRPQRREEAVGDAHLAAPLPHGRLVERVVVRRPDGRGDRRRRGRLLAVIAVVEVEQRRVRARLAEQVDVAQLQRRIRLGAARLARAAAAEGAQFGARLRVEQREVELLLERRQLAADDELGERRCVGRVGLGGAPQQHVGAARLELALLGVGDGALGLRRLLGDPRLDRPHKVAREALGRAEEARVCKREEREELGEVVLQRRAREQQPARRLQRVEAHVALGAAVLEPMRLVAHEQRKRRRAAQHLGDARRVGVLVRQDQDHLAPRVAPAAEVGRLAHRLAAALAEHHVRQLRAPEELVDLAAPVARQAGGAHEQHLAAAQRATAVDAAAAAAAGAADAASPERLPRRADESCAAEGVDERERLQRLAEAHVVGEDGARVRGAVGGAHDRSEEEDDALALVRPQHRRQPRLDAHRRARRPVAQHELARRVDRRRRRRRPSAARLRVRLRLRALVAAARRQRRGRRRRRWAHALRRRLHRDGRRSARRGAAAGVRGPPGGGERVEAPVWLLQRRRGRSPAPRGGRVGGSSGWSLTRLPGLGLDQACRRGLLRPGVVVALLKRLRGLRCPVNVGEARPLRKRRDHRRLGLSGLDRSHRVLLGCVQREKERLVLILGLRDPCGGPHGWDWDCSAARTTHLAALVRHWLVRSQRTRVNGSLGDRHGCGLQKSQRRPVCRTGCGPRQGQWCPGCRHDCGLRCRRHWVLVWPGRRVAERIHVVPGRTPRVPRVGDVVRDAEHVVSARSERL